ncbi:hypothetical protein ZWY2020_053597 [Hordeum vulgare]|nr:hypothetical protein ZWY2020_053597 [Hordeum vulgare]
MILATFTRLPRPTGLTFDSRHVLFNSESGTSMLCPRVAGIAGLLKALHPDWSPAVIKSVIMTTARVEDNTRKPMRNSSFQRATPFAYGAGHVQPNCAADPGLVYDMNATDYLHFLCALGYNSTVIDTFITGDDGPHACPARPRKPEDLNYPSFTAPHLSASSEPHTVTRRVRRVGEAPAAYDVRVSEPRGVSVSVRPSQLEFVAAGEEREFAVTFRAREGRFLPEEYVFGQMVWSDGVGRCSHRVRSPVVVRVVARRTSKTGGVPVA